MGFYVDANTTIDPASDGRDLFWKPALNYTITLQSGENTQEVFTDSEGYINTSLEPLLQAIAFAGPPESDELAAGAAVAGDGRSAFIVQSPGYGTVQIKITNVIGQLVSQIEHPLVKGRNIVNWAQNQNHIPIASGHYFARIAIKSYGKQFVENISLFASNSNIVSASLVGQQGLDLSIDKQIKLAKANGNTIPIEILIDSPVTQFHHSFWEIDDINGLDIGELYLMPKFEDHSKLVEFLWNTTFIAERSDGTKRWLLQPDVYMNYSQLVESNKIDVLDILQGAAYSSVNQPFYGL
jgi:hypothetical protein